MSWDSLQQQGNWIELDSIGSELSKQIGCAVRNCESHYHKPIFECKCSKIFPVFAVQSAYKSNDWNQIKTHHTNGT